MKEFLSLGLLLNRASTSLAKSMTNKLKENKIDLPHSQFIVLRCLFYEDGISQQQIASLLFKDAAAIKRTIDQLEQKGLVIREQIRSQKNHIYVTQEGKQMKSKILNLAQEATNNALKNISDEEFESFKAILNQIYDNTNA